MPCGCRASRLGNRFTFATAHPHRHPAYPLRARLGSPVAAPVSWDELDSIQRPDHFRIDDLPLFLKRTEAKTLLGWGRSDQELQVYAASSSFGSSLA